MKKLHIKRVAQSCIPFSTDRTQDVRFVSDLILTSNAEVIFYSVAGGGHIWPGGKPILLLAKPVTGSPTKGETIATWISHIAKG
jgi:poly(3-hydroxybutyrate) depolymerase